MANFVLLLAVATAAKSSAAPFPTWTYRGDSHFDYGFQLGTTFSASIATRMANNTGLHSQLLPFAATKQGAADLAGFLALHEQVYPDYVEELRGMAAGAKQPFDSLLLMSLSEEFGYARQKANGGGAGAGAVTTNRVPDHCSDYMLNRYGGGSEVAVAHNEDNDAFNEGHFVMVTATIGGAPTWTALVYLGELATGAFGFNAAGVAVSLNYLGPDANETVVPGLGRNFVARELLDQRSVDAAVAVATRDGQCAGHNYQVMDTRKGRWRIVNVESASRGRHATREVLPGNPPFFHANMYQQGDYACNAPQCTDVGISGLSQPYNTDSRTRIARAAAIAKAQGAPTTAKGLLYTLGDQQNRSWPIFHDKKSHARGDKAGYTLVTAMFNLTEGVLHLYHGNPRNASHAVMALPMSSSVAADREAPPPLVTPSQSPTANVVDWRTKGAVCPVPNLGQGRSKLWASRAAVAARCFLNKLTPKLMCGNVSAEVWTPPCKVAGMAPLFPPTEPLLLQVLKQSGPVVVMIEADQPCIEMYTGGIIDRSTCYCDSSHVDHQLLLVGAGTDTATKEDYWVLMNDWGKEWGEGGTVRIARNQMDTCGVALEASFPRCPCHKL